MTTIYQCVTFLHNVLGKSFYSLCGCPSISVRPQRKYIFGMYFPFSCLIRLQLIFSSFDAFLARKTFVPSNGESSSDMSDASSLQDFSKIFSLPSSESLVQSSYPESLSKRFSSRACLRFGIVTDDKNWISSSPTKVISDAILLVFSLRGILVTYTRVSRARYLLKIAHLSFSMGPAPSLKMVFSYGLRPRLWLLLKHHMSKLFSLISLLNIVG